MKLIMLNLGYFKRIFLLAGVTLGITASAAPATGSAGLVKQPVSRPVTKPQVNTPTHAPTTAPTTPNPALPNDTSKHTAHLGAHGVLAAAATAAGDELSLLRAAYNFMEKADHDYKGHRWHAMRHTAAAASLLGGKLGGDGHDKEAQTQSDGKVESAEAPLEQARTLASQHNLPKVVKEINEALHQISIALKVK